MNHFMIGLTGYFVIYWIVLFMVLPWGVERTVNPEPGHDPGAPKNPYLLRKFGITAIVAAAFWLLIYWALVTGKLEWMMGFFDFTG